MNRRQFLLAATAASVLRAQSRPVRTISYNVLACLGYPKTPADKGRLEAAQAQMPARMAQELLLYRPDIVTFCESVTRPTAERIAGLLGMSFAYFDPGEGPIAGYPIGFPGTVFTRFQILDSQNAPFARKKDATLFTRHWGRALLSSDSEELVLFSGHLFPHSGDVRMREIAEMIAVIGKDMATGRSILFQGDLNHTPQGPEYQRWLDAGLVDTFAAKGVGQPNTSSSIQPRGRIDYIWAYGPIAKRLTESRVLFEGAFRTNPDDPQSFALSDHLPVMATFD